jgi:hypothetical protein
MDTAVKEPATVGDLVDNLPAPRSAASGADALMRLIERASFDPTFDVAKLDKLLEVRDRWEAGEARKAYDEAFAEFKKSRPTIIKNKHVSFRPQNATKDTEYDHATLNQVVDILTAALVAHGFTHRWEYTDLEGGIQRVTCVLTHVRGHSERASLQAGADQSGGKNNIQAKASTVSYLERYTLLGVTGCATKDQDDDGRRSEDAAWINAEQKATLIEMMRQAEPDVDKLAARTTRFLKFFKLESLDDLPAARFGEAKDILQQQINAARKPTTL